MNRWQGKVAIVTGASAGIGAAIAQSLAQKGLTVVGLARRVEPINDLSKDLTSGKLYGIAADVSREEDVVAAFAWVSANLGAVHVLVNNAGVIQHTNLTDGDASKWRYTFDVNVLGLCVATREAVRIMTENGIDGHIVHINSMSGHRVSGFPNANVYPASKYAVTALTEGLRRELVAANRKIKSISPGFVDTDIMQNNNFHVDSDVATFLKSIPYLKCEDISDAVLYVLSTPEHVQVRK